jgi:hypothetical protein
MKLILLVVCLFSLSFSYASEVETQCSAMNESRGNSVKTDKPQAETVKISGSSVE